MCQMLIVNVVLVVQACALAQTVPASRPASAPAAMDREAMYERYVDHLLSQLGHAYELTDDQRRQVKSKLAEIRANVPKPTPEQEAEVQRLRQEAVQLFQQRLSGNINAAREKEVMEQLRRRTPRSGAPDIQQVVTETEALLTPEQREKGRAKLKSTPLGRRLNTGPRDPWEDYVRSMSMRYRLDESQKASAESILREAVQQRDAHRKTHEAEYAAARKIEDFDARNKRLSELEKPVSEMFTQLREKLDAIPTQEQKQRVTSRPSIVTTSRAAP